MQRDHKRQARCAQTIVVKLVDPGGSNVKADFLQILESSPTKPAVPLPSSLIHASQLTSNVFIDPLSSTTFQPNFSTPPTKSIKMTGGKSGGKATGTKSSAQR
jgi:hypothetical protein